MNINAPPIVNSVPNLDTPGLEEPFERLQIEGEGGAGVTCKLGYNLYTDAGYVREPEVFYIDDVGVPDSMEGQGLGTKVVAQAIDEAQERGFKLGRMVFINPRMVSVTEKILRSKQIKDVAYIALAPGGELKPEVPSEEALTSTARITADQAIAYLTEVEAELELAIQQDTDPTAGGVLCVLEL
ncbi:MAG TPA: GNAT family N-acetyltransferase [Verrucomicrobiae bacterium]|jgi:predicted GNAT family acetyltransferase|nr:GNAT family N-acetyltransferase [Verrucomicrobiae bacterium]